MSKKLFLLDAYALIYRAYYAFIRTPIVNSKGFNTSAIYDLDGSSGKAKANAYRRRV